MAMASRKLKNVSSLSLLAETISINTVSSRGSKGTTTSAKAPPTSRSASLRNAVGRVSIFDATRRIEMTSRLVSFVTAAPFERYPSGGNPTPAAGSGPSTRASAASAGEEHGDCDGGMTRDVGVVAGSVDLVDRDASGSEDEGASPTRWTRARFAKGASSPADVTAD